MKRLFKNYRLSENIEVLFMLLLGMLLQMTDGSPFSIKQRWLIVWNTELPEENFSLFVQKIIKIVLSGIVVIRCVTTYAYVVSAMLVIFSLLKNSAPKLMLLWLLISMVKSICMTFLEALTGVYVCSAFGKVRKACVEFFISKALEIIFAAYLWGSVLNIYQDLERKSEENETFSARDQLFMQRMDLRNYRARSLLDETTLNKTSCLNHFEFKDVPQIILQMLGKVEEMSQDSLLGPGMMLASVSNMGSFDNLKNSQSLGELGFVDLKSVQVPELEEDENMSPPDKALKFLKLTWSDVKMAQKNKTRLENDIFTIDDDTWNRLIVSKEIYRPKTPRTEVFMHELSHTEPDESSESLRKKTHKRSFDLKFGLSLFNFFREKDTELPEAEDDQDEEQKSTTFDSEEDDFEEETTPLFMSNIKEEVVVNRIRLDFVSKAFKRNTYATLYKQDYMSIIGPEVFDRATKLPKVTSLTKIMRQAEARPSASLPTLSEKNRWSKKKINFENEPIEKRDQTSTSELSLNNDLEIKEKIIASVSDYIDSDQPLPNNDEIPAEISITNSEFENETENKKETEYLENNFDLDPEKETEFKNYTNSSSELLRVYEQIANKENDMTENSQIPCFRKHKIQIKFLGKQIRNKSTEESPTCPKKSSRDSSKSFESQNFSLIGKKNNKVKQPKINPKTIKSTDNQSNNENNSKEFRGRQICSLTELLQKPLFDVLMTYYDLRKKMHVKNANIFFQNCKNNNYYDFLEKQSLKRDEKGSTFRLCQRKERKNWKSTVLETVAINQNFDTELLADFTDFISIEVAANQIIKTRYPCLLATKNKLPPNELIKLQRNQKYCAKTCDISKINNSKQTTTNSNNIIAYDFFEVEQKRSEILKPNDFQNEGDNKIEQSQNCSTNNLTKYNSSKNLNETHSNSMRPKASKIKNSDSSSVLSQSHIEDTKQVNDSNKQESKHEFQNNFEILPSQMIVNATKEENLLPSQESDESFSLFYSKAADLASPLLDMKRFIYPDHIHYSFKHVKKKGFDVDITGGLPLLVRESLTTNTNVLMNNISSSANSDSGITRRPMDLSFASTNAFTGWQSNHQNVAKSTFSEFKKMKSKKKNEKLMTIGKKIRKRQRLRKAVDRDENNPVTFLNEPLKKSRSRFPSIDRIKHKFSVKDYLLIQKLYSMHKEFDNSKKDQTTTQVSSTQLHSNKGRMNSMYNPAIFLQENKTRIEKKKAETQEERYKDMFLRLEKEALLQNKNFNKTFNSNRLK